MINDEVERIWLEIERLGKSIFKLSRDSDRNNKTKEMDASLACDIVSTAQRAFSLAIMYKSES